MAVLRPSTWTLRGRLLVVLATLLLLVCAVVGVVTVVAVRGFLVDRLDAQLTTAGGRTADAGAPPAGGSGQGGSGRTGTGIDFLLAPGQSVGTLGARISDGKVVAAGILQGGTTKALSASSVPGLAELPVDGRPRTESIGDLGRFRLLASRTSDDEVLVTGLPLRDVENTVYRLVAVEIGVGLAALAVATVVGVFTIRRSLLPLRRVAATATRVSNLPLERGEVALAERVGGADVDPRTEVGQVGGSLNRLLDHVSAALTARQASETRVRQFVADASHELRTPLAAIRGYAELGRRSRDAAPPELNFAMERIEAESARMTTLVEDLLLLARLDAGRPLVTEPVDLTRLLLDVVGDARVARPDHSWHLALPDEPVTVDGDAASLHQVLANLLANAGTHTPAGTTVTAGLASSAPGTVVVSVLDDGPGIDPDVLPTVFERFARGSSSRTRGAGSTGLGLAIVQAIVAAHHGTVHVTSRPGQTAFLVRLPTDAETAATAPEPVTDS